MDGGYSTEAITQVLALNDDTLPHIFAIGLQENCHNCNEGNLHMVGDVFRDTIKAVTNTDYNVIAIEATRKSSTCEIQCSIIGNHGTTMVIILAQTVAPDCVTFSSTSDCSSAIIPNAEKGVAAVRLNTGSSYVCFASLHLESADSATRRSCINTFLRESQEVWDSCDSKFIFGDFNTRTGDKLDEPDAGVNVDSRKIEKLKILDEMRGTDPYGTDEEWQSDFISYVNSVSTSKFFEGDLSYLPTYSIMVSGDYCGGVAPCYRSNRPISWTDRVIFNGAHLLDYNSSVSEYSDHHSVLATFSIDNN